MCKQGTLDEVNCCIIKMKISASANYNCVVQEKLIIVWKPTSSLLTLFEHFVRKLEDSRPRSMLEIHLGLLTFSLEKSTKTAIRVYIAMINITLHKINNNSYFGSDRSREELTWSSPDGTAKVRNHPTHNRYRCQWTKWADGFFIYNLVNNPKLNQVDIFSGTLSYVQ